jgi:sarcosine oxidase subunit beta
MTGTCDVAVVGGGLLGCAAAYRLAARGLAVTVIERGHPGCGASGANAGTLSVQNKEVRLARLALRAVEEWATLDGELGGALGYVRSGGVRVAAGDAGAFRLERTAAEQRAEGVEVAVLTGDDLFAVAPYLARDTPLATYCPVDGYADPLRAVPALCRAAEARGATVLTGTRVTALRPRGGNWWVAHAGGGGITAGAVVLAAGIWMNELLAPLGVRLAVERRVNQLMVTEPVERTVAHVLTNASESLTLKQVSPGTFIIGGGWQGHGDASGDRSWPGPAGLAGNACAALDCIPSLGRLRVVRSWARPDARTPDKLPLCGPVSGYDNLFVVGSGHAGFTFGLLMARLGAGLITGETSGAEVAPYGPERPAQAAPATAGSAAREA